jgi:hypothetical protein
MTSALTHLGAQGEANMVDVGDKAETTRTAIAEGFVSMRPAGEGFYEMPGSHHGISENASDKESASRLVGDWEGKNQPIEVHPP